MRQYPHDFTDIHDYRFDSPCHSSFSAASRASSSFRSPFQIHDGLAQLGDLRQSHGGPEPLFVRQCRNPRENLAGRDAVVDSRLGPDHRACADFQMSGHPDLSPQGNEVAKLGASRDSDLRDDDAVFTHETVVGDLHQIVDLGPSPDDGGAQGGPVDGGVGPDLHVILDDDDPHLGNLVVSPAVGCIAEAVAPHHGPIVDDDPAPDPAALADAHVGVEHGIRTDLRTVIDRHPREKGDPVPQSHPVTDRRTGVDRHVGTHDHPVTDDTRRA